MASDSLAKLKLLRDQLVEDRRKIVASILADPSTSGDASGDFIGLQHFIDSVEKALSHEDYLEHRDSAPPSPSGPR